MPFSLLVVSRANENHNLLDIFCYLKNDHFNFILCLSCSVHYGYGHDDDDTKHLSNENDSVVFTESFIEYQPKKKPAPTVERGERERERRRR